MLRWSCSRIVGSWVWKPGERHANPTSCIASPPLSLAVSGADGRDDIEPWVWDVLVERSSFRGRCRELAGTSGEEVSSFFTMIFGGRPCLALNTISVCLCTCNCNMLNEVRKAGGGGGADGA